MRRQAIIGALLIVGVGVVLGATVFRTDIAQATGLAQSVTVNNTTANPVPVNVTNASVPVHEQGTANVNVTNSSLHVASQTPVTGGGQSLHLSVGDEFESDHTRIASALNIRYSGGANDLVLWVNGAIVARFPGFSSGNDSIDLALTRPVSFDTVSCLGSEGGLCAFGWVGNEP